MDQMQITHQHFLKFFLLNKITTQEIALNFLSQLLEIPDATNQDLKTFIEEVNEFIKRFDLELVGGKSEVSGSSMIGLVQICSTTLPPECKIFDKKASLLFSKLLSKIALSKCKAISETTAVNLNTDSGLAKSAVQGLLQTFIKQMWFEEEDGMIFLGPRTIMELGSLLSSSYPEDVKGCSLCRNSVFYGRICLHCKDKFHKHCLNRFFKNSLTCPSCKNQWNEEILQDESRSDGPSRPKRPRLISDSGSDLD